MMGIVLRDTDASEPWYEVELKVGRWKCPNGLSRPLAQAIMDATNDADSAIREIVCCVTGMSYGIPGEAKCYLPFHRLDQVKCRLEACEDRLQLGKAVLSGRWARLLEHHRPEILELGPEVILAMGDPASEYWVDWKFVEVEILERHKQFFEGIHVDH